MKADTKYIKEPINLKLMLSRSNLCSGLARTCGFALLLATGVSCASPQNVLTEAEAADGWELLFDGKTLDQWKDYNGDSLTQPWHVVDGCIQANGDGSDLSVHYIKQIDAFRREVCRIAKTKGADEVVRRLNSSQVIDGEYQKFYQSFDSSFLDIFPNFIGQVNELLQPEFRFTPRSDSSLTTELRILAAIRLGITDSGHIASLLNCASATVYTYRTKLRNAALDRDNFEEQVSKTGL